MITVEIDQGSGFCFGVVNAIRNAEKELSEDAELYCLGDIVHNSREVARLREKGLRSINHEQMAVMRNKRVLLRAHGEPPQTYSTALQNGIAIIDATCPVVLKLQRKIRKSFLETNMEDSQIVIFGKIGHAEVNGLVGQTDGQAIVIEKKTDLALLDYSKNICLFSQTTMSVDDFREIVSEIKSRVKADTVFRYYDTICRQVANRIPNIREFVARHDLILFVAGEKSSNGKVLLNECLKTNPNTHLISGAEDIEPLWLKNVKTVGVCGATSTPKWLMEEVADKIKSVFSVYILCDSQR
ncbi:MAG: 4-hydroxy-3-methylbut-2-enyl diphosphate reductase [Dysgonamonadaceae bacterium]|jgi:4-hydroxy-3-methylbut-2-enyl diphosphate reductase|nr:4-hydroxy-3-methylbut-2-enyl diphosphate reductase [Dysgonamonadaceae bacterium]